MTNAQTPPLTKPTVLVSLVIILIMVILINVELTRPSLLFFKWLASLGFVFIASFFLQPRRRTHLTVNRAETIDFNTSAPGASCTPNEDCASNHREYQDLVELDHYAPPTVRRHLRWGEETGLAGFGTYQHIATLDEAREPVSINAFTLYLMLALVYCPATMLYFQRDAWVSLNVGAVFFLLWGLVIIFQENEGSRPPSQASIDDSGTLCLHRRSILNTSSSFNPCPILWAFCYFATLISVNGDRSVDGTSLTTMALILGPTIIFSSLILGWCICELARLPVAKTGAQFPMDACLFLTALILVRILFATDYIKDQVDPPPLEEHDRYDDPSECPKY